MSHLNDICRTTLEEGDDVLACIVVDLYTGLLLGCYHTNPHFTQAYLDTLAAAVVHMFRGEEVRRIEALMNNYREEKLEDTMEEIFFSSGRVFHFMKTVPAKNVAMVLVTKSTANMALGWHLLKRVLPKVESLLP